MDPGTSELISRCKAGERQALDLLYQRYRPGLLNVCRHYAKEDSVAEDLLHDAFVVILTSLDQLKQTDNPESWMTAIVRNVGYHYSQYVTREQTALRQMAKEYRQDKVEYLAPDYDQIQSLISQLPQGYQKVFRLSVFEDLTHQEISQLLGIAPHTSSSQLTRAKSMLRMLIRQSWVLMLLAIAIPTAVWWFARKQTPTEEHQDAISKTVPEQAPSHSMDETTPSSHYAQAPSGSFAPSRQPAHSQPSGKAPSPATHPQNGTGAVTDSIPLLQADSMKMDPTLTAKTKEEEEQKQQKDTVIEQPTPWQSDGDQMAYQPTKESRSWNISLAYNGQAARGDDFMAASTINYSDFQEASTNKSYHQFSNWVDYSNYLKSHSAELDEEKRSLISIATQNISVNNGAMEARYEHQLPITLQMMLSRQISEKASIETGLSYTQLNSTITTGSSSANIQEHQKLRYVGIPIRFGWTWYDKARLRFYSSAGGMLEMPIHSTVGVRHFYNGTNTFQKEVSPHVPVQWSVSLGLGAQYNVTPHLGIYLEPSLQYFINNGSDLKTYRTEHPFEFTLPLGLRLHW